MPKINSQKTVQNIFLVIGLIALGVMIYELGFINIVKNIREMGWWFIPVIGLWVIVYAFNTFSSMLIIRDGSAKSKSLKFRTVYKITITAFAINASTPVGLAGGEPYKIMEFKPYLGITKATSSVILFSMMHIVSHFCFWIISILLAIMVLSIKEDWTWALVITLCVCLSLMFIFFKGYRKGMVMHTLNILKKFPFLKKRMRAFIIKEYEDIKTIDAQITSLHGENKAKFYGSLGIELFGRILNCAEIYLMFLAFGQPINYIYCILIVAFVTLLGNLLFFSPMQIGTREGAFLIIFGILGLPSVLAVTISLITRIRELFWVFIGMLLMKITVKDGPKTVKYDT